MYHSASEQWPREKKTSSRETCVQPHHLPLHFDICKFENDPHENFWAAHTNCGVKWENRFQGSFAKSSWLEAKTRTLGHVGTRGGDQGTIGDTFGHMGLKYDFSTISLFIYCEAQGKGRAKGRPRKVTQRSFIDGGWWMVDILSLMLYTKFSCHHPPSRKSLNVQD